MRTIVSRAENTDDKHGDMVVHVKDRQLLPFLAHDDKECVAEVQHLEEVEDVHKVAHVRALMFIIIAVNEMSCMEYFIGSRIRL